MTYYEQLLARHDLPPGQRVHILVENRLRPAMSLLFALQGQFERSLALFDEARPSLAGPRNELWLERDRSMMLLRLGRYEEVLDWGRRWKVRTDVPEAFEIGTKYEALALVALDSLEAVGEAVEALESAEGHWGRLATVSSHFVAAKLAVAEGQPDEALEHLELMGLKGSSTGGLYSIEFLEMIALANEVAGRLGEAEDAYLNLLKIHAGHALAHYQLGLLFEKMNRSDDAAGHFRKFLEMWTQADEGLPQLEDARARLAAK
jgi:tetratricopeptide (TPR) repeat protein